MTLEDIYDMYDKSCSLELNDDNMDKIEEILQMKIVIYDMDGNGKIHTTNNLVRGTVTSPYENVLRLVVNNRLWFNTTDVDFSLLVNTKKLTSDYVCPNKGCYFEENHKRHFNRHVTACSKLKTVKTKQRPLGCPLSLMETAFNLGYVPREALSYQQPYLVCFDIETLEVKIESCIFYNFSTFIYSPDHHTVTIFCIDFWTF